MIKKIESNDRMERLIWSELDEEEEEERVDEKEEEQEREENISCISEAKKLAYGERWLKVGTKVVVWRPLNK